MTTATPAAPPPSATAATSPAATVDLVAALARRLGIQPGDLQRALVAVGVALAPDADDTETNDAPDPLDPGAAQVAPAAAKDPSVQLNPDDLEGMSDKEILAAHKAGRVRPFTAAEIAAKQAKAAAKATAAIAARKAAKK